MTKTSEMPSESTSASAIAVNVVMMTAKTAGPRDAEDPKVASAATGPRDAEDLKAATAAIGPRNAEDLKTASAATGPRVVSDAAAPSRKKTKAR